VAKCCELLAPANFLLHTVYLYYGMLPLGETMPKTRVTDKFQVTIPKQIREETGLKPGEVVVVERVSEEEILLKRFRRIKEPLKVLVGERPFGRHVPVDELEEKAETR